MDFFTDLKYWTDIKRKKKVIRLTKCKKCGVIQPLSNMAKKKIKKEIRIRARNVRLFIKIKKTYHI